MTTHRASTPADLDGFITTAKAAGVPDDALVPLLKQNGWSDRRLYASLSRYYGAALGVAPPSCSGPSENPRDAFYYLLNFITLALWTVALGQLFYHLIERWFPDAAYGALGRGPLLTEMSWQLATIMIAFPCFVLVGRLIAREMQRRPDAAHSAVRAWITYAALIIAALVVLTDGIWFLGAFLRGELSIRFGLDSLVLLVLGGGVFGYYLTGLRTPAAER